MSDIFFNVNALNRKKAVVGFKAQEDLHFIAEQSHNEIVFLSIPNTPYFENLMAGLTYSVFIKENEIFFLFHPDNLEPPKDVGEELGVIDEGAVVLKYHFKNHNKILVSFRLYENEVDYIQGTRFVYYLINSADKLIKCALDFGSEASQVIQTTPDKLHNKLSPIVMSDLIKSLSPNDEINFKEYIQSSDEKDSEADKYLRSIFFYQTKDAEKDSGTYPSQNFIKFLTKTNDIDQLLSDSKHNNKILPNLKLGYLNLNQYNINFDDHEVWHGDKFIVQTKKLLLSNFIEAVINFNRENQKELLLNFTLLYPNVYNQKTINIIQNELNEILLSKIADQKIRGFEINLLSESDAVFLGIKTKYHESIVNKKNYVIIDSGKGTTDYSIIKNYDRATHETQFRTGFVGAGNIITFSFLIALIHDVASSKGLSFEDTAKKLLKNLSPSEIFKISNKLNNIKIEFKSNSNVVNDFSSLDLNSSNIENVLDKIQSIQDTGGYIKSAVNYIVEKVYRDISPYMTSSTVIFLSGRSFKFTPLHDEIKKKFFGLCESISFVSEVPKTIALLGAFSDANRSTITLEGVPREIDATLFESQSLKPIAKDWIPDVFKKVAEKISDRIRRFEGENVREYENFLEEGLEVDIAKRSKLICSNTVYELPAELLTEFYAVHYPQKAQIRFDGHKFVALWNGKRFELKEGYNLFSENEQATNKFSMFPFVEEDKFFDYVLDFKEFLYNSSANIESSHDDDINLDEIF